MRPGGRSERRTLAVVGVSVALVVAAALGAPAGAQVPSSTTAVAASADVSVTLTVSPTRLEEGVPFTYKAVVTNNGPDPATEVWFVDNSIGGALTVPEATTSVGTCPHSGFPPSLPEGQLACDLGTLAPGASGTVTFTMLGFEAGPLPDTATVVSGTPDPNPANDDASVSVLLVSFGQVVVDDYYKALFHRAPTGDEEAFWVSRFDANRLFVGFVHELTETPTFRQEWIDTQFRTYLGRPAGSGAGYYLGWLSQGRSYDDVVASIVSSHEFASRLGGASWVAGAYSALTGDAIPASLAASYEAWLTAGARRFAVAKSMATGVQGRRKFVDRVTRQFLGRPATAFDLYINVSELLQGESPELAEASILASLDALNRFVPPGTVA